MKRLKHYGHRVFRTPSGGRLMDSVRSQLVPDGPEEYVRQDVLRSLQEVYGYPRQALLSEEPVARGTRNRGRADVLVELPAAAVADHTAAPTGTTRGARPLPRYADLLDTMASPLEYLGALCTPTILPEQIDLTVDGHIVRCRPLGFQDVTGGQALWLVADPSGAARQLQLPGRFAVLVRGYGLGAHERTLAKALAISPLEYDDQCSDAVGERYLASFGGWRPDFAFSRPLSDDGLSGSVVLHPNYVDYDYGVLAWISGDDDAWMEFFDKRGAEYGLRFYDDLDVTVCSAELTELTVGDAVVVEVADDAQLGTVTALRTASCSVRLEGGRTVKASPTRGAHESWLAGRLVDEDEEDADDDEDEIASAYEEAGDGEESLWDEETRTLIVAECKAPTVRLTVEVREQGLRYARATNASYLVLTNGSDSEVYSLAGHKPERVEDIPDYDTAISTPRFSVGRVPSDKTHTRLPAKAGPELIHIFRRSRESIGADTPATKFEAILRLEDALHATSGFRRYSAHGVRLTEDLGLRYHEPGNASGGGYPGWYRDFVLAAADGQELVFGTHVAATGKWVNHRTWKNSKSVSYLVCCLSFGAVYHPVLQMPLDRHLVRDADRVMLWHSGRATVGRGAIRNREVLEYVVGHQPSLVTGDRVVLGEVPCAAEVKWRELQDCIARLASYCLLRHHLKEDIRARRKK